MNAVMKQETPANWKVGDEITVLTRKGKQSRPYKIGKVARLLKSLVILDDGKAYLFRDHNFQITTDADRKYLAAERTRRAANQQVMKEREDKMAGFRSLFGG